jgi:hypothetical protein
MAMHKFEAKDGNGNIFGNGHVTVTEKTMVKIQDAQANGATIITNTNWRFTGHRGNFGHIEKLVQVNDKKSGKPKHIVWACYNAK